MRGKVTPPILVEQANALYPLVNSYTEVGRILGLRDTTVRQLIKNHDEYTKLRDEQKKLLILKAHKKAEEVLNEIDPKKAKSQAELVIVYGTIIDKNAVLAGENNKWSKQINVGDNRKINIVIRENTQVLLKRKKESSQTQEENNPTDSSTDV